MLSGTALAQRLWLAHVCGRMLAGARRIITQGRPIIDFQSNSVRKHTYSFIVARIIYNNIMLMNLASTMGLGPAIQQMKSIRRSNEFAGRLSQYIRNWFAAIYSKYFIYTCAPAPLLSECEGNLEIVTSIEWPIWLWMNWCQVNTRKLESTFRWYKMYSAHSWNVLRCPCSIGSRSSTWAGWRSVSTPHIVSFVFIFPYKRP